MRLLWIKRLSGKEAKVGRSLSKFDYDGKMRAMIVGANIRMIML